MGAVFVSSLVASGVSELVFDDAAPGPPGGGTLACARTVTVTVTVVARAPGRARAAEAQPGLGLPGLGHGHKFGGQAHQPGPPDSRAGRGRLSCCLLL